MSDNYFLNFCRLIAVQMDDEQQPDAARPQQLSPTTEENIDENDFGLAESVIINTQNPTSIMAKFKENHFLIYLLIVSILFVIDIVLYITYNENIESRMAKGFISIFGNEP